MYLLAGTREKLRKYVTQLYEKLKSCVNPFIEDGEELENINGKCIMSPVSSASVKNALNIRLQICEKFCKERSV